MVEGARLRAHSERLRYAFIFSSLQKGEHPPPTAARGCWAGGAGVNPDFQRIGSAALLNAFRAPGTVHPGTSGRWGRGWLRQTPVSDATGGGERHLLCPVLAERRLSAFSSELADLIRRKLDVEQSHRLLDAVGVA